MGITTVKVDEDLLGEAKEIRGATTARSAIERALRQVVMTTASWELWPGPFP